MTPRSGRAALLGAAIAAGALAAAAAAVGFAPLPGPLRAAGMLALPLALLRMLRRADGWLASARRRLRARPLRPPAPAAPGPRPP